MTTVSLLVAAGAAALLAFANGANDNSKGVATLIGSGAMSSRRALLYATGLTFAGSLAALALAGALLATFSGRGIVPAAIIDEPGFAVSVGAAAGVTVLVATLIGLPISTTHAIVGALVGVGLASQLNWAAVGTKFAFPLLAAPALAAAVTIPAYLGLRGLRRRLGIDARSCVCLERPAPSSVTITTTGAARSLPVAAVRTGHHPDCTAGLQGRILGIDAQSVLDGCHVLSAGAVSFARGLNDTPKIAAILLAAGAVSAAGGAHLDPRTAFLAVGIGIALGGLLAARRVAVTMARRITEMNDGQAFTANLVTAFLVIVASRFGMPVSTTHVSCGCLFGIGAANRTARWRMIAVIILAWITTLPIAAALGWIAWQLV